jgi:hypothetical protein
MSSQLGTLPSSCSEAKVNYDHVFCGVLDYFFSHIQCILCYIIFYEKNNNLDNNNTNTLIKRYKRNKKFEDTKGVIRSRKSKKDRQYNGQKIPKGSSAAVTRRKTDNTMAKRYQRGHQQP